MGEDGLRQLLLGNALSDRDSDSTALQVTRAVRGVSPLLAEIYGDTPATRQARAELDRIGALGELSTEVTCKRAALLYAMSREPEIARHFDDEYGRDMARRVLPFVTPRFLKHSCQAPDAFVTLCAVLCEMWAGERLGNWGAHNDPARGQLHERADGERAGTAAGGIDGH